MFYDNYVRFCNSVNKTPSAVALEIGLSKPTVNRWKNGGGITDATAVKVADYFGVSVKELTAENEKNSAPTGAEFDKETIELRSIWDSADESERRALLEMARLIKSRRG